MSAQKAIALMGCPQVTEEDKAAEAITPGHLISYDGNGDWVKNDTTSAVARVFALEREEFGHGIDDDYAIGDRVKAGAFSQGDRVYAFTPSGQNLSKGDRLEPTSNGRLKILASATPIAIVLEDKNNSAGPGDARIRIQIL